MQAILALEDGRIFRGKGYGAKGECYGEVVFNTSITGYQEIFTDPSYFGQLLVATHVHIGNYGIHAEEIESDGIKIAGFICPRKRTTVGGAGYLKNMTRRPRRIRIETAYCCITHGQICGRHGGIECDTKNRAQRQNCVIVCNIHPVSL